VEHGVNIETMVNRTVGNLFHDEFALLGGTPRMHVGGGQGGGVRGGTGGTPAGGGARRYGGPGSPECITVTRMRLEVPAGTDIGRLKREVEKVGKGCEYDWAERPCGPAAGDETA
jgi:hypothetical protein